MAICNATTAPINAEIMAVSDIELKPKASTSNHIRLLYIRIFSGREKTLPRSIK
jgi:hypothetical protein